MSIFEIHSEVTHRSLMHKSKDHLASEVLRLLRDYDELSKKLNTPELHNFANAIVLEAAHQRARWPATHDQNKTPEDWFWTLGHLASKATQAARYGDREKYLHHIVTTAALLNNWHAAAMKDMPLA